jgi:hypothetical protein
VKSSKWSGGVLMGLAGPWIGLLGLSMDFLILFLFDLPR